MPPKQQPPQAPFSKDERVLCFHMEMLYEAKILDVQPGDGGEGWQYKIHYKGWKSSWDDWVPQDRVRKFTDENKELAAQLRVQSNNLKAAKQSAKKVTGRGAGGSDMSSARGSEERTAAGATTQSSRGPRRVRDFDLEHRQLGSQVNFEKYSHLPHLDSSEAPNLTARIFLFTFHHFKITIIKMVRRLPARGTTAREPLYDTAIITDTGQLGRDMAEFAKREAAFVNAQAPYDKLLNLPPKDYSYVDAAGKYKLNGCTRFVAAPIKKESQPGERHPVIVRAKRMAMYTPELGQYYERLHPSLNIPIAGIPLEEKRAMAAAAAADAAAAELEKSAQSQTISPKKATPGKKTTMRAAKAPMGIFRTTRVTRSAAVAKRVLPTPDSSPTAPARVALPVASSNIPEETFHSRPSIKIPIPDHIKSMLVDDWENVTKNQQLVPLPHAHPVEEILNDYLAFERPHREEGSASLEILEETVAGLRNYFDRCLGRILLYRFERAQYFDFHQQWNSGSDCKQKSAVDTYGAEHLARLLVSLPELIAQTNMDQQSVNRLREELTMFANWFGRHAAKYFVSEYETPGQEYIEQARSV
ncbi:MRG-domain-containing protein [Podospora aff. communis PSN243]|uniref:Chromatin modification-related protein EAF3 n=1 Tax=Podospora aff. communis PSN243 TaxID=3040156 RepID=A0AAV9H296_9PEZI|nr:MRG-domain-containing protein [Podospora aff. communis PSN243]